MKLPPGSLAGRFALASAGMAAAAVLLVSLLSWWLIDRQQTQAQRQFHAVNIGHSLQSIADRMTEIASSTILASGLVDSAGKETYLGPFLNGIRQIDGISVQVLFTDFEGKEIAANSGTRFEEAHLDWLRRQLIVGQPAATVLPGPRGHELVAMEPLRFDRTASPEGAVLYKLALADLHSDRGWRLEWSNATEPGSEPPGAAALVDAPDIFKPIGFRLTRTHAVSAGGTHLLPQFLGIGFMAVCIFAALFVAGSRLARVLTRDLMQLEAFSSKVMSAGASGQRAPEGGSTEVASLAGSINGMLDRLYQQHEDLKLEGEKLAQLAEALKVADHRKDEFLAMLAHELRNPLSPISTGAELLRAYAGTDDRVRRTSEIIARQVCHMRKLVDDLLDVSRVTRGLVTLERVPVDMASVIAAAVEQVRPGLDKRGHRFDLKVSADSALRVMGDPVRLAQVLSNLLQNACKYTPDGGKVALSARAEKDEVVIEVADNGSGITPEFMPELFSLFTQGSRTPDRSQGGLGLGLALVRHLVELHGGTVRAYSGGKGQGATFTVRVPRAEGASTSTPQPLTTRSAPEPLSLLLVDDNVEAARTLAALLEMEGHQVDLAHDGPSALERVGQRHHDVFILDIGLPGMDGVELAQRLRALPCGAHVLLVALTGYGQQSDRSRTRDAGFDRHLVKPVDLEVLKGVLGAVRRRRPTCRVDALP